MIMITYIQKYPLLIVVFILVGCNQSDVPTVEKNVTSTTLIGWLHGNCLAIKDGMSPENVSLYAVDLESTAVINLRSGKKAITGSECYALMEDRSSINTQDNRRFYTVASDKPVNLAIGIVYTGDGMLTEDQVMDLNHDGKQDTFTSCSTTEGMMFSIWAGEAYKSEMIWSDYYYLGYDSEADCPDIKW